MYYTGIYCHSLERKPHNPFTKAYQAYYRAKLQVLEELTQNMYRDSISRPIATTNSVYQTYRRCGCFITYMYLYIYICFVRSELEEAQLSYPDLGPHLVHSFREHGSKGSGSE